MKLHGIFLAFGVVPTVRLTCAQVTGGGGRPSAIRGAITRFAKEDISDVGVTAVHAIASGDEQVAEDLIEKLEADGQTTGETPLAPFSTCGARKWVRYPLR